MLWGVNGTRPRLAVPGRAARAGGLVRRTLLVVLLAGTASGIGAGPGWAAAEPPPDVHGLSVADAREKLQGWDPKVVVSTVPTAQNLPQGLDPAVVVVATSTWLNPTPIDFEAPQVELALGSAVPDLAGMTQAQATDALTSHGLTLDARPEGASADWVQAFQRPAAGTIVALLQRVTVEFAPPAPASATPPAGTQDGSSGVRIRLLAGGGGVLLLLVVGTALGLRRASRRRAQRAGAGAGAMVQLVPHYDPGRVTLYEQHR
jgi:PASTA domain-containing protein